MGTTRRGFIAWVAALCVGCSSSTAPDGSGLEGYWDWVSAFGGIAGTEISPTTVGYTMAVEFAGDRVVVYRDGAVHRQTTMEVRTDAAGVTGTLVYADEVFGWPEHTFELRDGNTLILVDPCCDGFAYTFARGRR